MFLQQPIPHYSPALERSGYNHNFEHKPIPKDRMRNNQKRKIIWFNPPFNNNTSVNIGRVFLNLVKKHFPRQNKFYKILHAQCQIKNDARNKRILTPTNADTDRTCNCTRNTICPLDNNCLTKSIVYKATISSDLQNFESKNILVYAKALSKNGFLVVVSQNIIFSLGKCTKNKIC